MIERNTSWWASVPAVVEFELRRAITIPRLIWWCVLAFFPVAIILLLITLPGSRDNAPEEVWQIFLFCLIPMLVSMLGTFMWTSSAISSELEGQSWIYIAVRPGGRMAVVVGKFLVAIAWVLPATLVGVTLSIAVLWLAGSKLSENGSVFETWFAVSRLCFLSVPAYAAIYLAIGTLFTKRAMIVGVAYTLVFELVVSFIPALINKFTIQYRLRSLFIEWGGIDTSDLDDTIMSATILGSESSSVHIVVLVCYTLSLVFLSSWLVRQREYLVTTAGDMS